MSLADDTPLLRVARVSKFYGNVVGCRDVSFDLYPGEVLGVVGESGSGKTTLLHCISAQVEPSAGTISYATRDRGLTDIYKLREPERRMLMRTDWGFVHQNPRDGLRMDITAGGNVAERLIAVGARNYGAIRH